MVRRVKNIVFVGGGTATQTERPHAGHPRHYLIHKVVEHGPQPA
jgi:hypothetical protein